MHNYINHVDREQTRTFLNTSTLYCVVQYSFSVVNNSEVSVVKEISKCLKHFRLKWNPVSVDFIGEGGPKP